MSETIEVRGTEFDADDLRTAIDELLDEDGRTPGDKRFIQVGDVAVMCDGHEDEDAYLYSRVDSDEFELGCRSRRQPLGDVREKLERVDGPMLIGRDKDGDGDYGFKVPLGAEMHVQETSSDGYHIAWHSEDDMAHDLHTKGSSSAEHEDYDCYAYIDHLEIEE